MDQLAALPELKDLSPVADLDTANIGEPEETTRKMDAKVRDILEKHHKILLEDGNTVSIPSRPLLRGLGKYRIIICRKIEWAPDYLSIIGWSVRKSIDQAHALSSALMDDLLIEFETQCGS
ncbi:hypothetical protein PHMEG_00012280 [Phytophthora megakarya]|uniref:Uncharacterized protein n=1 Tax=Phytophthora megakarya TaxID=4795 RepID=A0A225WAU7_9STRA|nr:hypothetical protein PHMEG_00012280 [Phytophthora megakarya]